MRLKFKLGKVGEGLWEKDALKSTFQVSVFACENKMGRDKKDLKKSVGWDYKKLGKKNVLVC